jgi:hypothetical protein
MTCVNSINGATVANGNCIAGEMPATSQPCNGTTTCTCFIAGTQVTMADGTYKDIEDVVI